MQKVYPSIKICNNRGNKILQIIRFKSTKEYWTIIKYPFLTIGDILQYKLSLGSTVLEKATKI